MSILVRPANQTIAKAVIKEMLDVTREIAGEWYSRYAVDVGRMPAQISSDQRSHGYADKNPDHGVGATAELITAPRLNCEIFII